MQDKDLENVLKDGQTVEPSKHSATVLLDRIKEFYGFSRDSDLANFLGTSQGNLSSWRKRGRPNLWLIIEKCQEMNLNWLFRGQGLPNLKANSNVIQEDATAPNAGLDSKVELLREMLRDKTEIIELLRAQSGKK